MLIQARMRVGASWSDACIVNLSSRGMLVQSGTVPERGHYLEIRRGSHVVVARVVWSRDQRFGVRTQDPVSADDLIREAGTTPSRSGSPVFERRSSPRSACRYESSRQRGKAFEFGSLALFGVASAFLLFATVDELLGHPMRMLETALAVEKPR